MTAINPQAVRGPVTAVPVVAGTGVRFVEDVPNNRVVAEVDETVLWESATYIAPGDTQQTYTLSESPLNFRTIKVYLFRPMSTTASGWLGYTEFDPRIPNNRSSNMFTVPVAFTGAADNNYYIGLYTVSGICTTTWTDMKTTQGIIGGNQSQGYFAHIYKIVGVNRIASA